jgi:hypothetical protein
LVFGGLYLQQTRKVTQAQTSAAGWRQDVSELQSSRRAQESDAADAQIKEFLGDDNFVQFQAYEKSLGERMAVSGFKDQLGNG